MRRLLAAGAAALLVLGVVPFASAVTAPAISGTSLTGNIVVLEPGDRTWMSRFEVRTTASGGVQFGYLELYGIGGNVAGQIHEFTVDAVAFARTASGAQAARLSMRECRIIPSEPCFPVQYEMSDGSAVGAADTFLGSLGWTVQSGDISIRASTTNNPVVRVGRALIVAGRAYVDVDLRSQGGLGANARCFAELQTYRAGVWVAAVRPNYPVAGKLRIYLNKALASSTYVAWNVAN